MKYIPTTKGHEVMVCDCHYDKVKDYSWHYVAGGYAGGGIHLGPDPDNKGKYLSKGILMHRIIMDAPPNMCVDHINGDPSDNRCSNLRLCTHAENMRNSKVSKNNKSGLKGVSIDKQGFWVAHICFNRVRKYLGRHETAELAHKAYMDAARELHGKFARAK